MYAVRYNSRDSFFDRPRVIAAVGRAKAKNLSQAGAYVRTAARELLRVRGNKASRRKAAGSVDALGRRLDRSSTAGPGEPPRMHEGGLRRGVWFAYDASVGGVIVGPVRYNVDGGRVPALLEYGGRIRRLMATTPGGRVVARWANLSTVAKTRLKARWVTNEYDAHPYMAPALEQEAPKFPGLWANTVRAA